MRATGAQGSGILRSMAEANCFIVLEHERGSVEPGRRGLRAGDGGIGLNLETALDAESAEKTVRARRASDQGVLTLRVSVEFVSPRSPRLCRSPRWGRSRAFSRLNRLRLPLRAPREARESPARCRG
ncbi:MAG: hypothetical protein MZW92_49785 [Comamonadaceae bacterium]|nr:hypothetical protein [Comamonadaceae bacterium]